MLQGTYTDLPQNMRQIKFAQSLQPPLRPKKKLWPRPKSNKRSITMHIKFFENFILQKKSSGKNN